MLYANEFDMGEGPARTTIGIWGEFKIEVKDPDGSVVHVRESRNRLTKGGVDMLLGGFFGRGDYANDKFARWHYDNLAYEILYGYKVGLGVGTTSNYDYYDRTTSGLESELPVAYNYSRQTLLDGVQTDFTWYINSSATSNSYASLAKTFTAQLVPAGPATTLTEVGIWSRESSNNGGEYLLCASRYTGVPCLSNQDITATYTLNIRQ